MRLSIRHLVFGVALALALVLTLIFGFAWRGRTLPLPDDLSSSISPPAGPAAVGPQAGPAMPTALPAANSAALPSPAANPSIDSVQQTLMDAVAAERPVRDLSDLAARFKRWRQFGVLNPDGTYSVWETDEAGNFLPVPGRQHEHADTHFGSAVRSLSPGDQAARSQIGRQDVFWVSDQHTNSFYTVNATLSYVTPHAYFYVLDGERVPADALRRSAENFESQSYPIVHRYFGDHAPGVDGDFHITVLNARNFGAGIGGYFSSDDQYPRSASPHSNERNIVYVSLDSSQPGTRSYDATLAHEFQHLVLWNVDRAADTWVNEGCSELAMRLTGTSSGGVELAYANQPDTQLNGWSNDDKTIAHYGAGYLFVSYFAEHYGGYDALPELLAQRARGTALFDNYLAQKGYPERFDDVFRDWLVANYLDDPQVGDGRYGYQDVNLHAKAETVNAYPFRRSGNVEQYGAQYFDLRPAPGDVTVNFTGTMTSKLLDNNPKSGRWEWWSNRGDLMDTTLSREFDLRGLDKATLQFAAWYDIERGYDYAYVEVSTDGGQKWKTLPGRYSTTEDPIGHNLGQGFTGKSGGETAQWVDERVDLSAYVGHKIVIRFEHITDDALNRPGFAVDDIVIPELGFRDDAEQGPNGWQSIGFVRTQNIIPQSYSLQLLKIGTPTTVESIPLNAAGHASFTTAGLGRQFQRIVLVVSPTAPVTSEQAPFELSALSLP